MNHLRNLTQFVALIVATVVLGSGFAHAEPLQTNAVTVACLGDSITHAGYPGQVGEASPRSRHQCRCSWNTSRQGLARLKKDVLDKKPDVVVVFFGTNDNRQDAPKIHVPVTEYAENLTKIIDGCRGIGARVVLGTIPPIDPTPYFTRHVKKDFDAAGGLEALVAQYHDAAVRVGQTKNVPVIDLQQLLAADPSWRSEDGVHPTPKGNVVIAKLFAKQLESMLGLKSREKLP